MDTAQTNILTTYIEIVILRAVVEIIILSAVVEIVILSAVVEEDSLLSQHILIVEQSRCCENNNE
jgi:hypothetical protein